jgi:hypothetical protein
MGNENNLIPLYRQSKEKQREIRSMGGKQSGVKRREKRDLKHFLEVGLELLTKSTSKELAAAGEEIKAELVKKIGIVPYSMLEIAVSKKANEQTRLNALEAINDRIEGKAINKSIIDANVKSGMIPLSDEEREIITRQIEEQAKFINKL